MKTLPLSEVKTKLSGLVDEVLSTDEAIIITKNGRPAAVLVSPSEHESWKETLAIQRDPALTSEIKAGLKALKGKKAKLYTLEELLSPGG